MNWIETYHLRSSPEKIRELIELLPTMEDQLPSLKGLVRATLLKNVRLENSLLLMFEWESDLPLDGSRVGLLIKEYLSQFGLIKEDLWYLSACTFGQNK